MVQNAKELFSAKAEAYHRYVSLFLYPQGLRAVFTDSGWLREGIRVLDAGCGTGILMLAFLEAQRSRGYECARADAFDLTPAMLERFGETLKRLGIERVELHEANVLKLELLPSSWKDYDMVISASMLEYVPRQKLPEALAGLRSRLADDGRLLLLMTRRNWLTQLLVERPWGGNRYSSSELAEGFTRAGFGDVVFHRFPPRYGWLNRWGYIVEGTSQKKEGMDTDYN